jgi:hypothetical protein
MDDKPATSTRITGDQNVKSTNAEAPRAEGECQVRQLLEVVGLQKLQCRLARRSAAAQDRLKSAIESMNRLQQNVPQKLLLGHQLRYQWEWKWACIALQHCKQEIVTAKADQGGTWAAGSPRQRQRSGPAAQ